MADARDAQWVSDFLRTQNLSPTLTTEHLESALVDALRNSLQPLQAEIQANTERVIHLEQDVQDLSKGLKNLPQHLSPILSRLLMQLQAIVSSETSSNAWETLQMQLRQLISALTSWNSQLKTELSLQQQLIDSIKNLERKLDNLSQLESLTQEDRQNIRAH